MPDPVTAITVGGTVLGGALGGKGASDAADASASASRAGVAENRRQFDTAINLQAPAINTGNAARSLLASILGLELPASSYTYNSGTTQPTQSGRSSGGGLLGSLAGGLGVGALAGDGVGVISGLLNRINERRTTQPVAGAGGLTFNTPASSPMSAADITARLESFPGYKFAVDQATKSAQALGSATGSLGGNVISALGERVGGGIAMPTFQDYLNRLTGLAGGAQTASTNVGSNAITTGGLVAQGLQNAGDARASGIMGQTGTQIGTLGGILGGVGQMIGNRPAIPTVPQNPGSVGGGGYRYGP